MPDEVLQDLTLLEDSLPVVLAVQMAALTAFRVYRGVWRYFGVKDAAGEMIKVPLLVIWLVLGAIFFTLRMGFINLRGFKHAVLVTAGRYDNKHDHGEVTHFQALTAALSATVGLGNIAGVAIAVAGTVVSLVAMTAISGLRVRR